MSPVDRAWGKGILEQPVRVFYARRWERWLAVVWPPRRRRLRMMQAMVDCAPVDVQRIQNHAAGLMFTFDEEGRVLLPTLEQFAKRFAGEETKDA